MSADDPSMPEGFAWSGRSHYKIRCLVCHQTGYPHGPWMQAHRRGHLPCPRCGTLLTVLRSGKARVHGVCPKAL